MRRFALFLMIVLLSSCGGDKNKNQYDRLVKTMVIGDEDSQFRRNFPGRVVAGQKVDLAFQVSGTLKEFPVKEGQKVSENELLAQLDQRDYQNRYEAAKAQLNTVEMNYRRGETLVKSNTISQATFDELRAKYETAKSNASIYEKALQDTSLYAPFDGLVARTFVNNFQEVQAKERVLSLQNVEDIDILIDVPEQILVNEKKVREGLAGDDALKGTYLMFDAVPERHFQPRLKEYATEADPTTQTYRITLTMKAPSDLTILPGMSATLVAFAQKQAADLGFALPVTAVAVDPKGQFYVWVVDEKTLTVHKKNVEVGEFRGESVDIKSGLNLGERIVIAGVPYLEEGMKVRLFTQGY